MNIEMLQDSINVFTREIIDSGFKRDLDDYASSLPASQNNIVAIRDIADKVLSVLDHLYSSDFADILNRLLPKKEPPPFTSVLPYNEKLRELLENTEIKQPDLFNQLTSLINQLRTGINKNNNEIATIRDFIAPYLAAEIELISEDDLAVIAIVFNEQLTTTSLERFTKTLAAWNKVLPLYHQLINSNPPEDIRIVEVQNGSIDLIVNLDLDVTIELAKLFQVGFNVFAAYLTYKQLLKPIVDSYHGNKRLIALQEEQEQLLLDNIGTSIHDLILEQHKAAKKADKHIDGTAVEKKVEQVTNLIGSHIVKGNDFKLLALPETVQQEDDDEDISTLPNELREQSVAARRKLGQIPQEAQDRLLEAYGKILDPS